MARITLDRQEVEKQRLPAVCMRCGAPATESVSEESSGQPRMSRWVRRLSQPTPLMVILVIVVWEWSVNFGPKWQGVSVVAYLVLFLLLNVRRFRCTKDHLLVGPGGVKEEGELPLFEGALSLEEGEVPPCGA